MTELLKRTLTDPQARSNQALVAAAVAASTYEPWGTGE
jgi:hypothetical protein